MSSKQIYPTKKKKNFSIHFEYFLQDHVPTFFFFLVLSRLVGFFYLIFGLYYNSKFEMNEKL